MGQAWFDGAKSIIDPRYNQGTERLPMWVLNYWKKMNAMADAQKDWERAYSWPNKENEQGDFAGTMHTSSSVLASYPWKGERDVDGFPHKSLRSFFLTRCCATTSRRTQSHSSDRALEETSIDL